MRGLNIIPVFLFSFLTFLGCGNNKDISGYVLDENDSKGAVQNAPIDYREEMRSFVIGLGKYAKSKFPNFKIIPQNGIELVTLTSTSSGAVSKEYLEVIDGNGQENLFYGHLEDNVATQPQVSEYLINYLNVSKAEGNAIFVIDYCWSDDKIRDSYIKNRQLDYISFTAPDRNLKLIPDLEEHASLTSKNVKNLDEADNFLFVLNYSAFSTKTDLVSALSKTDYDILFIDMFFNDGTPFSKGMIESLKNKANGGKRMVICYMSIGEAEDYRYYWNKDWNNNPPSWLREENSNWPGNYKVAYWEKEWQNIIFGSQDAYLDRILDAGYDGVYMDIIDAFDYFENLD